jgi:phenylalanyl-tRNA synthetase alpha chain
MLDQIQSIKNNALSRILSCESLDELEEIRIAYFGKNGEFTLLAKRLPEVEVNERRNVGLLINEVKTTLLEEIDNRKTYLNRASHNQFFDPTIPGIKPTIGHTHLVTQAINEIHDVFSQIGFVRVRYPEVEWDWFSFGSLNMNAGHPARDEWETFFVNSPKHKTHGEMVLTPHTSSGQVREMQRLNGTPPIRMINIAKCYRRQLTARHLIMFHQFEGLVVDENISITHLKGTLDYFARTFFGKDRKTRLRPFHFQFTEPSFEVDITCGICNGSGKIGTDKCKVCKGGWLELGGAGMVHPVVLKNGGIDPNKYSGFAFGWGVERTFMMKAGLNIPDIRMMYSADLDYLRQF